MDHFNATVKDGKLVKTRRGLQVSRQTFNGLSFVNASPHETTSTPGSSGPAAPSDTGQQEIRFVQQGSAPERKAPGTDGTDAEQPLLSGSDQGTRRRRRTARRARSPGMSSAGPTSRSSSLPVGEPRIQHESTATQDAPHAGSILDKTTLEGTTSNIPLSGDERALFVRHINNIPRCMYPYEDILAYNSARETDYHTTIAKDPAGLSCVLMCGSVIDAVTSGTETDDLAYYISKTCAILNQKLSQDASADPVALHCIATLAWVGCYAGRFDHWHLHMTGLKKVLDVNGGRDGLSPCLQAMIHTADIRGATALATSPYLPFTPHHSSVTGILPSHERDQTATSISAVLSPLHIHLEVIHTLSCVANFASAIRLARSSQGPITFHPDAFTEEWQALAHALLTQPAPLRETDLNDPDCLNPYTTTTDSEISDPTDAEAAAESYISSHRLLPSISIIPTPSPNGPLEPAVRIAALLYLKELLPEYPRNLGGYAVLLTLLRHHLGEVINLYGTQHDASTSSTPASGTDRPSLLGTEPQGRSRARPRRQAQPLSEFQQQPQPRDHQKVAFRGDETNAALKKTVLFLALIGDSISRIADSNENRIPANECYPRDVYRECLTEVVGLRGVDDKDLDGLLAGEGHAGIMELVRVFGLAGLFGRGEDGEGGESGAWMEWEEGIVKRILTGL